MKKSMIGLIFGIIAIMLTGCISDIEKLAVLKAQKEAISKASECNCYLVVIWPDGTEEKMERPFKDMQTQNQFLEKCGNHRIEFDDEGTTIIKCLGDSEQNPSAAPWQAVEKTNHELDDEPPLKDDEPENKINQWGEDSTRSEESEVMPKSSVKAENPEVSGGIDKRIIQKVVRQHTGELRTCYERQVAKVKGLNGRITVEWIIAPQGNVSSVALKESTMKNKDVESCVTNSIKFWRFPAPKGGGTVKIEYPFVFQIEK